MLFKWFFGGAIVGFIVGLFCGGGLQGALFFAILAGAGAVALRKWVFKTFWG